MAKRWVRLTDNEIDLIKAVCSEKMELAYHGVLEPAEYERQHGTNTYSSIWSKVYYAQKRWGKA